MKSSKTFRALCLAVTAITFSLVVSAQAQTFTALADFNSRNAYPPDAPFVQGTNGNLFTVSMNGGTGSGGVAFSIAPAGKLTDLYNFCKTDYPACADGLFPDSLVLGKDGNFYGTTFNGGTSFAGVVFKMTPGGKQSTLYTLCATTPCSDGQESLGIVLGNDGNFYGTTATTIFRITPSGEFKTLFTFPCPTDCPKGWGPVVPPIQGRNGNFYGTASNGGINNSGVVYEITPEGHYSVLHRFCSVTNCTDGQFPSNLVEDASGNLYGITAFNATIFKITPNNHFSVVHSFDASSRARSLIVANDGNLYGATVVPGDFGGTIFQMTPSGVFTTLYQFPTDTDPEGFMQATDGVFYGTTDSGGSLGYGEAFSFSNNLSPFVKTVPGGGNVGERVLILGHGLTGTTSVTFNGVPANFTVEKDTFIRATVPTGATTGKVSVVTPSGTLDSNPQFVVTK